MTTHKTYVQIKFEDLKDNQKQLLIAQLSTLEQNGMEEEGDNLIVYFEELQFEDNILNEISQKLNLPFTREKIQSENWNKEWERNFEPIVINGFCCVRADFHPKPQNVTHDILITPKMSFGTGHHATTWQMMDMMQHLDFQDKSVLDFGTGTGILAVLASKLEAKSVMAIDNDEWSFENAEENFERNEVKIELKLGSLEVVEHESFDIILANINLHILKMYHSHLWIHINPKGLLLISGILVSDIPEVTEDFTNKGFTVIQKNTKDNWAAILFQKE